MMVLRSARRRRGHRGRAAVVHLAAHEHVAQRVDVGDAEAVYLCADVVTARPRSRACRSSRARRPTPTCGDRAGTGVSADGCTGKSWAQADRPPLAHRRARPWPGPRRSAGSVCRPGRSAPPPTPSSGTTRTSRLSSPALNAVLPTAAAAMVVPLGSPARLRGRTLMHPHASGRGRRGGRVAQALVRAPRQHVSASMIACRRGGWERR